MPSCRRFAAALTAAEKPYWVEPMQTLNAGFNGNPGYVAQFGDSITFSLAFSTALHSIISAMRTVWWK